MGKVLSFNRDNHPRVLKLLSLGSYSFQTTLKNQVISGTVTKVFWDSENSRVVLTLDTVTVDDGGPLCVDLYPFGVPNERMKTPFGTHVPIRAKFRRTN